MTTPTREPLETTSRVTTNSRPARAKSAAGPAPVAPTPPPARSGLQFAPLVLLTYVLGPLAIVLTPQGRRSPRWVGTGIFFAMAWVTLAFGWSSIMQLLAGGGWALPWLAFLVSVLAGGYTVWSRALKLAGGGHRPPIHKMPVFLRHPWSAGGLGCLAPGLSLLVAGRSTMAAAVLWLFWPAVAGMLVLMSARSVLGLKQVAGQTFLPTAAFEILLLGAATVLCGGIFLWTGQALVGVRKLLPVAGIRNRVPAERLALGLLAVLMAVVLAWDPPLLGAQLSHQATALREQHYRVIPLTLTQVARRCDPTKVDYTVMAIELYRELGRENEAAVLRSDLDSQLASYLSLMEEETKAARASRAARDQAGFNTRGTRPVGMATTGLAVGMPPTPTGPSPAVDPSAAAGDLPGDDQAR